MKTTNELKGIVEQWFEKNKEDAAVPSAEQFRSDVKEDGFEIVRCKDVKEGLSVKLESGGNEVDGILMYSTGQMVCKESFQNEVGSTIFRGATMG